MKNVTLVLIALLPILGFAQATEGVIQYEEVMKMEIDLPDDMKQYAALIPSEERSTMDLFFNKKESLYKKAAVVEEVEENPFGDKAEVHKVIVGGPGSSEIYCNIKEGTVIRAEDAMGKSFLVTAERIDRNWKIGKEQKEILGYSCMKAESVTDSTTLTAWFTPQIPVAVGPYKFYGLPGAILSLDYSQDDVDLSINALSIELKDIDTIERPKKGKKVTEEEYRKIMESRMKEMDMMMEGEERSTENGNVKIKISTRRNN